MGDDSSRRRNTLQLGPISRLPQLPKDRCTLVMLTGPTPGAVQPVTSDELVLGRDPEMPAHIDDRGISGRHARLFRKEMGFWVEDLGSTNGTFVNGVRTRRMVLREGDRIQIGPDVVLRFGYRALGEPEDEPRGEPQPPAELSARELEIARLVAEGLSNELIGKRLHISPRTVGTHLGNIYRRLELHTRAALTRYVLERGLLRATR